MPFRFHLTSYAIYKTMQLCHIYKTLTPPSLQYINYTVHTLIITCFGHQVLIQAVRVATSMEAVNKYVFQHLKAIAVHAGKDSILSMEQNV